MIFEKIPPQKITYFPHLMSPGLNLRLNLGPSLRRNPGPSPRRNLPWNQLLRQKLRPHLLRQRLEVQLRRKRPVLPTFLFCAGKDVYQKLNIWTGKIKSNWPIWKKFNFLLSNYFWEQNYCTLWKFHNFSTTAFASNQFLGL